MLLLLYAVTAALVLWLTHRFLVRLSLAAAAFLFLIPFLFAGHALIANRIYAPIEKTYITVPLSVMRLPMGVGEGHNPVTADIFSQMIPWRHVVRESYMRGEWPLWNPYILSGDVLAAAAQPAPYSPFTLLAILLPAAISFTFTAAITFLLAAIGAFVFARDLGCRESAAAIAAGGFAYSSAMALYVLWPLGMNWALLPLVLIATRRVVHAPGVRACFLLMSALVLLILAGHGQSAVHIVAISAAYGVFDLVSLRRNPVASLVTAGVAGALALSLCAIFLLPHIEAIPQSAEYELRKILKTIPRGDTTPQVLVSLATNVFPSLHLRRWIDPAVPGLKGETAAVGSIVLALAVYAIWRVRSRTTWFFATAALFCLGAHASWTPVARLLQKLPLFDMTINERLAFGAAFFLVMLAAIGVEHIAARDDRRAAAITLTTTVVLIAAGTLWIARNFVIDPGPVDWGDYKIFAELAFPGLAALLFALRVPMRVALPALVALLLAQRVISEGGVHESSPSEVAYPRMAIFEPLAKARKPFRVAGDGWSLIPGTAAAYGLEDVRGYEAVTFLPYFETYPLWCVPQGVFFNRIDDLSKPFLSLMNVRYAFVEASTPPPPGWRVAARQREALLIENTNALERAFVPRVVSLGLSNKDIVEAMKNATDFRERAWLSADEVKLYERVNGPGRVTITESSQRGYELDADMQGDGWVIVTNTAWEGWRAYMDGRRVKIQRANNTFLGIYTPPGRHHIRLVYWPDSFVRGRVISFGTMIVIFGFAILRSRRVAKSQSRKEVLL